MIVVVPTLILSDFTLFDRNRVLSSMFSIVSNSYLFDIGVVITRGEEGGGGAEEENSSSFKSVAVTPSVM